MSGGTLKMRKRGKNGPLFKTFVPLGTNIAERQKKGNCLFFLTAQMSSKVVRFYPFFAFWVSLRTFLRSSKVGRGKILARARNWKIKFLALSEACKFRVFILVGRGGGVFFGAFGNFREKRLALGPCLYIQIDPNGFFDTRTPPSPFFWRLAQG